MRSISVCRLAMRSSRLRTLVASFCCFSVSPCVSWYARQSTCAAADRAQQLVSSERCSNARHACNLLRSRISLHMMFAVTAGKHACTAPHPLSGTCHVFLCMT